MVDVENNIAIIEDDVLYHAIKIKIPRLKAGNLVGPEGLEPSTKRLWVSYSNQLSYGPLKSAAIICKIRFIIKNISKMLLLAQF